MSQHLVLFDTTSGKCKRNGVAYGGASDALSAFNGIVDSSLFTISYSAATRILTVTYGVGASVLIGGTFFGKTGSDSTTAHANTSGKYYFYYDAAGALTVSTTPFDLTNCAPCALIYYNATTVAAILIDERHPALSGMDNAVHRNLHLTRGTQTVSGFAISGHVLNTAGAANLSYAIASGVIADEDLFHNVSALADGGPYRILSRSGANGDWIWDDASTTGILDNGTNLYYNQFTGGAWQKTAIAANNTWVNYYVAAVPEYSGTKRIVAVMGQATFGSLAAAQAEDPAVGVAGLSNLSDEFVFMYRMTYRRVAGTPSNAQLAGVQGLRSNTISVTGGFSPSDHQSLSNRTAIGSHPATAISTANSGVLASATDLQGSLDILGALPSNLWTEYLFDVSVGGQTEFVTAALTGVGQQLDVRVNGVAQIEGVSYDWQRNVGANKVIFNKSVRQYGSVVIRVYK